MGSEPGFPANDRTSELSFGDIVVDRQMGVGHKEGQFFIVSKKVVNCFGESTLV